MWLQVPSSTDLPTSGTCLPAWSPDLARGKCNAVGWALEATGDFGKAGPFCLLFWLWLFGGFAQGAALCTCTWV